MRVAACSLPKLLRGKEEGKGEKGVKDIKHILLNDVANPELRAPILFFIIRTMGRGGKGEKKEGE